MPWNIALSGLAMRGGYKGCIGCSAASDNARNDGSDFNDGTSLSAAEKANSVLAPKSFSEEELNRYLDTVPAKGNAPSGTGKTKGSNR